LLLLHPFKQQIFTTLCLQSPPTLAMSTQVWHPYKIKLFYSFQSSGLEKRKWRLTQRDKYHRTAWQRHTLHLTFKKDTCVSSETRSS
jgi:hypothetical protein